jgi:hypothetical protein
MDLLTHRERKCLSLLSEVSGLMREITYHDDYPHDWEEAAAALHVLQRMVMGQAAVRAYPGEYRPLGGWLGT